MGIANVNSITINTNTFNSKYGIVNVDLGYTPWVNNNMTKAFYSCLSLKSVTHINENVTNMFQAFRFCDKLVNAPIIPNSVTNMQETFGRCTNLVNAPIIPNSVTNMSYTFDGCTNLVNAPTIPTSTTNIHECFGSCSNLVNPPLIPPSVTTMSYAFRYCYNLKDSLYIFSTTLTEISDCIYGTQITSLYLPYNTTHNIYSQTYNAFNSSEYNSYIKENPYFEVYNNQYWYDTQYGYIHNVYTDFSGDVIIPNTINVTNIKCIKANFYNNQNITSIDFNNVRLSPYTQPFFNCRNLTYINNSNFYGFSNFNRAFTSCSKLNSHLVIPNSVTDMNFTFMQCWNLANTPDLNNVTGVTIMLSTFYNCTNLVNAPTIPNSVVNMLSTFYSCTNLVNAPTIPNSVTYMGQTFKLCSSLVNAPTIPNSVIYMYQTFNTCSNLTGNIYINSNQITNAIDCFYNTSLTKNVYIPFTYVNGVNTLTYNSFIAAGYTTDGTVNGVYLIDSGEH